VLKDPMFTSAEARGFMLDAQSDRSAASFPVTTVKNRRGQFQILDFTSFTKPGGYILRCGQVSSRPFAISDDLWYGTTHDLPAIE